MSEWKFRRSQNTYHFFNLLYNPLCIIPSPITNACYNLVKYWLWPRVRRRPRTDELTIAGYALCLYLCRCFSLSACVCVCQCVRACVRACVLGSVAPFRQQSVTAAGAREVSRCPARGRRTEISAGHPVQVMQSIFLHRAIMGIDGRS
jgi:hypothetical protein